MTTLWIVMIWVHCGLSRPHSKDSPLPVLDQQLHHRNDHKTMSDLPDISKTTYTTRGECEGCVKVNNSSEITHTENTRTESLVEKVDYTTSMTKTSSKPVEPEAPDVSFRNKYLGLDWHNMTDQKAAELFRMYFLGFNFVTQRFLDDFVASSPESNLESTTRHNVNGRVLEEAKNRTSSPEVENRSKISSSVTIYTYYSNISSYNYNSNIIISIIYSYSSVTISKLYNSTISNNIRRTNNSNTSSGDSGNSIITIINNNR